MRTLALALLCLALPAQAYDVNGVKLGAKEAEMRRVFPSAHCKDLEWKSNAADRRCDDARGVLGGAPVKVTAFLKGDAIQGFELRFDTKDIDRVKATLRSRWGEPLAEVTETIARRDGNDRKLFKMRWEKGGDRAVLTAQLEKKRAGLEVSRGRFADEIYRVR
jgi:hypothetical protein